MIRTDLVNTFHKRLLDEGVADSRAPSIARAVQALHSSLCSLSLDSLKELRELHPDLVNLCLRFERDEDKVLNERFDLIYSGVQ